jgi:hypothetical protein
LFLRRKDTNMSAPTTRSKLGLVALATAGAITLGAPGAFAVTVTTDPLHGYCAVGCIDNGTNAPTSQNPPVNFGFTVSPGPASGSEYMVDVLVPDNETAPSAFALSDPSGTATLFSATPWTSGFLDAYLGISATPANPIGAYLPSTVGLDPGATGFFVFSVNLGPITLQGPSNPNVSPLEDISPDLPLASYIVAFLNEGTAAAPDWFATANSGAIFETGTPTTTTTTTTRLPVPEPASLALLGSALAGLGLFGRRRRKT